MEKAITPSTIVPEVLKRDNYKRWRILMQHYFEANDLWDVVTSKKIPRGVSKREWTKKNASALLVIKILCEAEVYDKIEEMNSAKEVWDTLADMHKPPCAPSVSRESVQHHEVVSHHEFRELLTVRVLSEAIRYGRMTDLHRLIGNNGSVLLKPDADNRIPVQLACNTGHERMTRYLYSVTPLDKLTTEIRFKLLEECINKKMFDIAFDLLQKFSELADPLSCPSSSVPIILTLAQTPPSFFGESQLIFWKQWLYKCTRVKTESIQQIKEENFFPRDFADADRVLIIILMACCPWMLLLLIFVWIYQECVPRTPQFIQQSLARAQKIHQQSLAILQQSLGRARKILQHSLPSVWRVMHLSCDEFRGRLKGVLLRILKMLLVLLLELTVMPFLIVTVVVVVAPTSVHTLILDVLCKLVTLLSWAFARQVYDQKTMDEYARKVIPLICQPLSNLDQNQFVQSRAVEATFQAIKNGIPEIVYEIKEAHPDFLWSSMDPEGSENIFALAVAHRQEKVAQIIYGSIDTNLLINTDEDGNNALHIAAKLAPHFQLGRISGAALQLQSEVRWFKSVERIVPRFCNECKNVDGETPFQVFAREHKNLLKEAEEWMKKTAESSTVVGALIITIMFAVAFTVPGGNEQNSGYPIFLHKEAMPFMVFIVSDAISLFTASSSVLMFLGILTSRYDYEDFLKSLPIKLIIGISSLFISIATMTIAFCAALFIMLHGRLEVVIPLTLFAGIPIAFFGWLQFPLLVEICTSTFSRDIFRKEKEKESFLDTWFELFCQITIEKPMEIMG